MTQIDGNKLWIKAVLAKKRGGFTKLMEAMTEFGFELTDTSVTTSNGAMLVSSCVIVSTEIFPNLVLFCGTVVPKNYMPNQRELCTVQNRHR